MSETAPDPERLPAQVLQEAASYFALLSATGRLHILWELAHADCDVGTLAATTGQSVPTVSHHLSKLKMAGLVDARRVGKRVVYVIAEPGVVAIVRSAMQLTPVADESPLEQSTFR